MPNKKKSNKKVNKSGVLSCKNVVARTDFEKDGIKIKKKTLGTILYQRKTPGGHGRATVDFGGKEVEVETSKIRCV